MKEKVSVSIVNVLRHAGRWRSSLLAVELGVGRSEAESVPQGSGSAVCMFSSVALLDIGMAFMPINESL